VNWRSRPLAAVTAVASLLAAGVLASTGLAAAAPATAATHVAAAPLGTHWRVADPAAYARAIRSGNWTYTPEGLAPKSCVNHVPAGGIVAADGDIVTKSGAVHHVTRCTTPTLAYRGPQGSWVKPAATPGPGSPCSTGLSGGWWAATCSIDSDYRGLLYYNENFSIPSNPTKDGALIFYFPAFQSADGSSIVQPVLTWGANASTGVTNGNIWYLTSWAGVSGTYYTSKSVHINTPGTVNGLMQRGLCTAIYSGCAWTITTSDGSASAGFLAQGLPTMTQIFGGVMEVPWGSGCVETPPNGHEAFRNLVVHDYTGTVTPSFAKLKNPSPQCSVSPAASSGINTDITWTS
jgi:hypothetical protein